MTERDEPTVFSFDSTEEMFAFMRRSEEAANAAMRPGQAMIRDAKRTVYAFRVAAGIPIFGEIPPLEDTQAEERKLYNLSIESDRQEYEFTARQLADSRSRGYVFGRWYSEVEPEGELGSVHVSSLIAIGQATFEQAKQWHWRVSL